MTATEGTVMPGWDLAFYQLTLESRGWSPHTVTHRASAAKVMAERLGHADPAKVTRRDMVAYVAADRARRAIGGHCTHYQDCKCYWDFWAAETGRPSPLTGVPRPREPKEPPEVHVLTQAEMRRILEATAGTSFMMLRDRAIVMVLASSGMRRKELVGLETSDVDVRTGAAEIRFPKKGTPIRTAYLTPDATLAVSRYLLARGRRFGTCTGADGRSPLFVSRSGTALSYAAINFILKRIGKRAEVPGLRAHWFRHKWAGAALRSGTGEQNVCILAGWTGRRMLARYTAAEAQELALDAARAHPVQVF